MCNYCKNHKIKLRSILNNQSHPWKLQGKVYESALNTSPLFIFIFLTKINKKLMYFLNFLKKKINCNLILEKKKKKGESLCGGDGAHFKSGEELANSENLTDCSFLLLPHTLYTYSSNSTIFSHSSILSLFLSSYLDPLCF